MVRWLGRMNIMKIHFWLLSWFVLRAIVYTSTATVEFSLILNFAHVQSKFIEQIDIVFKLVSKFLNLITFIFNKIVPFMIFQFSYFNFFNLFIGVNRIFSFRINWLFSFFKFWECWFFVIGSSNLKCLVNFASISIYKVQSWHITYTCTHKVSQLWCPIFYVRFVSNFFPARLSTFRFRRNSFAKILTFLINNWHVIVADNLIRVFVLWWYHLISQILHRITRTFCSFL